MIFGHIDSCRAGVISGWLVSLDSDAAPLVTVNGVSCELKSTGNQRLDVAESLGVDPECGFEVIVNDNLQGAKDIKLYAVTAYGCSLVHESDLTISNSNPAVFSQICRAKKLSLLEDSVAITVWDGTHNPIGRAKVLYDIVSHERPAVIFAYDFQFSESLWKPLISSGANIVIIPWGNRDYYYEVIKAMGITFNTVWACKPRLPTLDLAKRISHRDTSLILDVDDNEDHMSRSKGSLSKPYGSLSINYANLLASGFKAVSCASVSLANKYNGDIVRHARPVGSKKEKNFTSNSISIVFIGTVRPHKNLIEAARNIKIISKVLGIDIKFSIGGDFNPYTIRQELADLGVDILGHVDVTDLNNIISNYDFVLTGFPSSNDQDNEITKYQISSKIGDALACGIPALVPESPSVTDLSNVDGIYLFNRNNLLDVLRRAISSYKSCYELPDEFSIDYNYKKFLQLELIGRESRSLNTKLKPVDNSVKSSKKNVVFVWKQHDSGIYGRRIDQLARSFKKSNPDIEVTILELMPKDQYFNYKNDRYNFSGESEFVISSHRQKVIGYESYGVKYKTITFSGFDSARDKISYYLSDNLLMPENTLFILYPLIPAYNHFLNAINGYDYIVDMVDNQLSWAKSEKSKISALYQYKTMSETCKTILFNSSENFKYYTDLGVVSNADKCSVIPNFYTVDSSLVNDMSVNVGVFEDYILYTGNLNDRFDWETVDALARALVNKANIVIAGNAKRAVENIIEISEHENLIYLGVVPEEDVIPLVYNSKVCVMPHISDDCSTYMNPLKVKMYESLGKKCITYNVPGLDAQNINLEIVDDIESFIEKTLYYLDNADRSNNRISCKSSCYDESYARFEGTVLSWFK